MSSIEKKSLANGGTITGTLAISTADQLTVGGIIVPQHEELSFSIPLNSQMVSQYVAVFARAYQITNIRFCHAAAGTDAGSVWAQVTKEGATAALPGTGTALLTNNTNNGFDCKATAGTNQTGILTATTADLQVSSGAKLSIKFTGVTTALTGVLLTISLKRI